MPTCRMNPLCRKPKGCRQRLTWTEAMSASYNCTELQKWQGYCTDVIIHTRPGASFSKVVLPFQRGFEKAALNTFIPHPVLIPAVAPTQVQDPAPGFVETHEVHMGPLLKLVQVPLDGIPSLRHVNCTTRLGVVCKLAEGALDPTVYVTDEDIKEYWSQYGPLRDTPCHRSPSGR
ncbi:hypothetical protein QYF61_003171 [Mycteria americana]|uniref:Uncharacterized protein n=1 Tax=Mycteria americana TaxID=33587 RepID=A0AAN7NET0_MYCAM|nr:hypothetical protein QYF61_003171 [Mycteria americana]